MGPTTSQVTDPRRSADGSAASCIQQRARCDRKEKKSVKWSNKELVMFLKDRLKLEENKTTRLKISENLANSDEFMTYEIIGKL